eukprot:gene1409-1778_t
MQQPNISSNSHTINSINSNCPPHQQQKQQIAVTSAEYHNNNNNSNIIQLSNPTSQTNQIVDEKSLLLNVKDNNSRSASSSNSDPTSFDNSNSSNGGKKRKSKKKENPNNNINSINGDDNDVTITSLDESITRLKISELLINYTHNYNEARFHLEKAALLLDESSPYQIDLLCKISAHLVEIFYNCSALNLSKQWIKKGLRYSMLLSHFEWTLYFLIKESTLSLKDNTMSNSLLSASTLIDTNQNNNLYLKAFIRLMRCHFCIITFDYSIIEQLFKESENLIIQMNNEENYYFQQLQFLQQLQPHAQQQRVQYPSFYKYILEFPSTNQIFISRSFELKLRDIRISFRQLKVYYNLLKIMYLMRIGAFKLIDDNLRQLQIDLQDIFNEMLRVPEVSPVSLLQFSCAPQYLSCVCYALCGMHSRALGEIQKSVYCFEKSLDFVDQQLKSIYTETMGNVTPLQMKESRSLLRLKFAVHENLFYIRLTALELDFAFCEIQNCWAIYQSYPTLFQDGAESVIHIISALYLQTVGQIPISKDHLTLALKKAPRFDTQIQCIMRLITCYMYMGEIDRASNLMNDYIVQLENHPQLILRSTALFLEGVIQLHYQPELAKSKFRDCLNLSNNSIGHSQLTANILNNTAKLYISLYTNTNDIPPNTEKHIRSMLGSSFILSTLTNDLFGKSFTLETQSKLVGNNNEKLLFDLSQIIEDRDVKVQSSPINRIEFLQTVLTTVTTSLNNDVNIYVNPQINNNDVENCGKTQSLACNSIDQGVYSFIKNYNLQSPQSSATLNLILMDGSYSILELIHLKINVNIQPFVNDNGKISNVIFDHLSNVSTKYSNLPTTTNQITFNNIQFINVETDLKQHLNTNQHLVFNNCQFASNIDSNDKLQNINEDPTESPSESPTPSPTESPTSSPAPTHKPKEPESSGMPRSAVACLVVFGVLVCVIVVGLHLTPYFPRRKSGYTIIQ